MTSVFELHKDLVLGHYSTAAKLRAWVLALYNGADYPVDLSWLGTVDERHYTAALAMLQAYRQHGERDPTFMALAEVCLARRDAEAAAAARARRWDTWSQAAQLAVARAGARNFYVDDHAGWFERQFEAGMEPDVAAAIALSTDLDTKP